jgi:hypothetical protein
LAAVTHTGSGFFPCVGLWHIRHEVMPKATTLRRLCLLVCALAAAGPTVPAHAQATIPCEKAETSLHVEAVAEVRRRMSVAWLEIGQNYYSGYRMKSPPANPFDVTAPKAEPGAKQVEEGYIWAAGIACELAATGDTEITVILRAGATSFAEKGARWTPPLYDRPLTQFVLARRDAQWAVRETRGEDSVLTADDELRRPAAEELPSRSKKLGLPCTPEQVWERKRCVARAKAKVPPSF